MQLCLNLDLLLNKNKELLVGLDSLYRMVLNYLTDWGTVILVVND